MSCLEKKSKMYKHCAWSLMGPIYNKQLHTLKKLTEYLDQKIKESNIKKKLWVE